MVTLVRIKRLGCTEESSNWHSYLGFLFTENVPSVCYTPDDLNVDTGVGLLSTECNYSLSPMTSCQVKICLDISGCKSFSQCPGQAWLWYSSSGKAQGLAPAIAGKRSAATMLTTATFISIGKEFPLWILLTNPLHAHRETDWEVCVPVCRHMGTKNYGKSLFSNLRTLTQ